MRKRALAGGAGLRVGRLRRGLRGWERVFTRGGSGVRKGQLCAGVGRGCKCLRAHGMAGGGASHPSQGGGGDPEPHFRERMGSALDLSASTTA